MSAIPTLTVTIQRSKRKTRLVLAYIAAFQFLMRRPPGNVKTLARWTITEYEVGKK